MRVLVELWRSTVGRKALVALLGLLLGMWVVLHLLGNLTVFSGAATADGYAAALQQIPAWLWIARAGLAVAAVVHVTGVVLLTRANRAARPRHDVPARRRASTLAARSMRVGGHHEGEILRPRGDPAHAGHADGTALRAPPQPRGGRARV
jgi:succinate dehydrogenase / fumarate reductase, cytochrome b subunit